MSQRQTPRTGSEQQRRPQQPSSQSAQHFYPPSHPTGQAHNATTGRASNLQQPHQSRLQADGDLIEYLVHTETNGISDLRLQLSYYNADSAASSEKKQPHRPAYFRERILTEKKEIVDQIIDANTGRVRWTIHRPTRGWYLYLRSPVLPPGTAISLRSAKLADHDSSISPLSFTVNTKIRLAALRQARKRIFSDVAASKTHSIGGRPTKGCINQRLQNGSEEEAGSLDGSSETEEVAIATGREETSAYSGHARKRSAAGTSTQSSDKMNASRRKSKGLFNSPMIPEVEDNTLTDDSNDISSSRKNKAEGLQKLDIPSSASFRAGADRPYSPTEPDKAGLQRTQNNNPELGSADLQRPRPYTFVLSDGGREPRLHIESSNDSDSPKGAKAAPIELKGKQTWSRWIWSILPEEVRPVLSLDTSKSFSISWVDPPNCDQEERVSPLGQDSIEVLRFQDQSGWWMWDSQTRGRLTLQRKAIEAIGLEQEFWITAALAYIQFLEEKDGYEAAREG